MNTLSFSKSRKLAYYFLLINCLKNLYNPFPPLFFDYLIMFQ